MIIVVVERPMKLSQSSMGLSANLPALGCVVSARLTNYVPQPLEALCGATPGSPWQQLLCCLTLQTECQDGNITVDKMKRSEPLYLPYQTATLCWKRNGPLSKADPLTDKLLSVQSEKFGYFEEDFMITIKTKL